MSKGHKPQKSDIQVSEACPMDGESAERLAERIDIETKLASLNDDANDAYATFGKAVFKLASNDDALAGLIGDAFEVAKENLHECWLLECRLEELEEKRLRKIENRKRFEEADAAAKELGEEAKRLEEQARQAQEEADQLAREAQERADQLNALLEEGRRKHDEAIREAEAARAVAELTMLFDLTDDDESQEAGDFGEKACREDPSIQALENSFETPGSEAVDSYCEQPVSSTCVNPEEAVVMTIATTVSGEEVAAQQDSGDSVVSQNGPSCSEVGGDQGLAAASLSASRVCGNCGSSVGDKDSFCMECGALLKQVQQASMAIESNMCPNCGNVHQPGDAFCMMCGAKL